MKRPKGPELKVPDLKVPTVLSDLFYDLRDRRLLPLIGLVVVAIVATPFLLGKDAETTAPLPTPAAIQALKESDGRRTASLTVVEAKPGLRDYRRRLRNRTPLDPFRSPAKPSLKGAQLGKGGDGKGGASDSSASFTSTTKTTTEGSSKTTKTTTTKTTTTTDDEAGGEGSDKTGGSNAGKGTKASTYTIDVEISSTSESGVTVKPLERSNVQPLTPLPGKDKPVVTYLGAGSGATRALFNVSDEVSAVYGEAKCVSGTDTCELLELEPDFPVTFVYGPNQARYKIKLLRIEPAQD